MWRKDTFIDFILCLCLCLWFRASLFCINNWPTRCNTKQSIYCSASSLYMFRVSTTPIIRSTQNCSYSLRYSAITSLQRDQAWPRWREVAAQKVWPVPEAVVTVLCAPDDGCGWHPKHVQWTCRIISRLLRVASRWTIINICLDCMCSCQLVWNVHALWNELREITTWVFSLMIVIRCCCNVLTDIELVNVEQRDTVGVVMLLT